MLAPLVIGVACFGQAQATGSAMEQARPEPAFERGRPPAHDGLGDPQPLRGAGEALGLHGAHESRHIVEKAHISSGFTNNHLQK